MTLPFAAFTLENALKTKKKRKHMIVNISFDTVWNGMIFFSPEWWRLRQLTIKLTDFNVGSFSILENDKNDDLWELLFEPWCDKSTYLSFQFTASEIIHFTCIYDDYQVKWFFEIPANYGFSRSQHSWKTRLSLWHWIKFWYIPKSKIKVMMI